MKYIITIYNRETGTTSNLYRTEENITATIEKELGGWPNLFAASTSGISRDQPNEYMQAGTTRDNKFVFSILCVKENVVI